MSTPQNLSPDEMSTITGGVASATSSSSIPLSQLRHLSHAITDAVGQQRQQQQSSTQMLLMAAMFARARQG
jgi:hypothetical protein